MLLFMCTSLQSHKQTGIFYFMNIILNKHIEVVSFVSY